MATKGVTVDEKFLRDFLAKGGSAATPTGTPVASSNVNEFLQEEHEAFVKAGEDKQTQATIKAATQNDKAAKLHEKVEAANARTAEKEEQAALKRAENEKRELELERQAQIKAAQTATGKARAVVDAALSPAKSAADRVASTRLPPGGIGLLLVIIGILLFTVVQVNAAGDTRMKQLWYMLNGRTELNGRVNVSHAAADQATNVAQDFQNIGTDTAQVISDLGLGVASGIVHGIGLPVGIAPLDGLSYRELP